MITRRDVFKRFIPTFLAFAMMASYVPVKAETNVRIISEVRSNLALGKDVTTSGVEDNKFSASNVTDGVVDRPADINKGGESRWASSVGAVDPWITIDLGEVKSFDEIAIEWERRNVNSYKIEISGDNVNWTTVHTSEAKNDFRDTLNIGSQEGRYIRITIEDYLPTQEGSTVSWETVSIYEVEVYGKDSNTGNEIPTGVNLALNKNASSSSVEASGLEADKAFDGIADRDTKKTRWATNGQKPQWISVDLGKEEDIYNIVLEWERRNATSYKVQVSNDNSTWSDVYTSTSSPKDLREIISFDEKINARYIRLYIDNFSSESIDGVAWNNVSLYEMEVYNGTIPELPEKPVKPEDIANNLVIEEVKAEDTHLKLPVVPEGYKIEFVGANYEEVIDNDLTIHKPLVDTNVIVNFEVIDEREGVSNGQKVTSKNYTITVPGKYEQSGNEKPTVIPELSEWVGGEGNFEITEESRIVIDSEELREIAEIIAEDYKDITGNSIEVVVSNKPSKGDIYFKTSSKYPELREEGYFMNVGEYVEVEANTTDALFLSSRSILQILKLNKTYIPQGIVRDYPEYDVRGVVLDVARKTFTMDFLEDITKTMSWYKMNDFQVHLNDNYIFLEEYGENALADAYAGFRLESSYENEGRKLTSEDLFYTKDEFGDFIDKSDKYGVNIVPEIDAPAHALSFTRVHPELAYGTNGRYAECLDVRNPVAVGLVKTVMDEYLDGENPVFRDKTVHVGADEYKGPTEAYRAYVDTMLGYVQEKGHKARVWGSLTEKQGTTPVRSEGVEMNVWNCGYSDPSDMYEDGYDIINTDDGQVYIVPAAGYYGDYLNIANLYKNYEPNKFCNGDVLPAGSPQMKGGMFGVWNDSIDNRANGIAEYDVYDRMLPVIQVLGEKLWGDADDKNFDEWETNAEKLGTAPNSNPYYKVDSKTDTVVEYDFTNVSGESVVDKSGNEYNTTDSTNVEFNEGLTLKGGESFVKTPIENIGPNYKISFGITRDANSSNDEQILFESPQGEFKAVQKETGKVGFSREGYNFSFDYELPKGEEVELTIVGTMTKTELYVNGEYIDEISKAGSAGQLGTFVFPLGTIGSETKAFNGNVKNLEVVVEKPIQPDEELKIPQDQIIATTPNGQDQSGEGIDKAFDGDKNTIWHSNWSTPNTFPMEANIDLNGKYEIDTFTYLPRQSGTNGYVKSYELQVSNDNGQTYTTVKTGSFNEDKTLKVVRFDAVEATNIKFVVNDGVGGFTSAAEINIYKAKEIP